MDSGFIVTQLIPSYIPQVVKLHLAEWSSTEISVKLGRRFLQAFYTDICNSLYASGFIALFHGEVVAYVCVFSNYPSFNLSLLRHQFFNVSLSMIQAVIRKQITLDELLAMVRDDRKLTSVTEPQYHLGAIAISKSFRSQYQDIAYEATHTLMLKAHQYLLDSGAKYVWGSCDASNLPMSLFFANYHYHRVATLSYGKRVLWIFEAEVESVLSQGVE